MKKRAAKSNTVLSLPERPSERIPGHLVGRLLSVDASGPLVTFPGNPHGPLLALSTVEGGQLARARADAAILLVFERESSSCPIIVGLLQPQPAGGPQAQVLAELRGAGERPVEALVDGKRTLIGAEDEIVLRCGRASITLRRNGRVIIRGVYVETRAEGVNRVKGGSVQIN